MGFLRKLGNFWTFGAIDRHDAKKIKNQANEDLANAKEELEDKRSKTEKSIEKLGNAKLTAYSGALEKFYNCYTQISKADRKPFKQPTDTVSYKDVKHSLITISKTQVSLKKVALQSAGAVSTGALVAGGTYFAVKGLVFGKLAGVAAKNATLAWLGGGSLASGGAGMAGGMVVLGGIALAPVALFSMYMGYSSGKRKLNDAMNYADGVEVFVQKVKTLICELNQIERAAKLFTKTIISMDAVFPDTHMQHCIVHMVRSSTKFVSYKDLKAVCKDLKEVYSAITVDAGHDALEAFGKKWNDKYPMIQTAWERNWNDLIEFFNYPMDIRKAIYTTNAIESLNFSLRKITRNKSSFPDDDSIYKVMYLAIRNASKRWTMPIRNWALAVNQFAILFDKRVPIC